MSVRSAVAAGLLVAMAGAWWWVLSGPSFRPGTPAAPVVPASLPSSIEMPQVELGRLDGAVATRQAVRRNPFGGATAVAAGGSGAGGRTPPERVEAATMPSSDAPATPRISLIGMSAQATPAGVERVAVFAGERGVLHARVGDVVADVYRVQRIDEDIVVLVRLADEQTLTLRLR